MIFEMPPHILHRVEIRCIGRQSLRLHPSFGRCKIVGHQFAAVNGCPIPDDQHALFDVALEVSDELHDLRPLDAAFVNLKVEAFEAQAAYDGKAFPTEALQQQRCLSTRSPRAGACRFGAQSAFVNEDDDAPLTLRVFFNSGQVLRCHARTAFSSRSMARLSGL